MINCNHQRFIAQTSIMLCIELPINSFLKNSQKHIQLKKNLNNNFKWHLYDVSRTKICQNIKNIISASAGGEICVYFHFKTNLILSIFWFMIFLILTHVDAKCIRNKWKSINFRNSFTYSNCIAFKKKRCIFYKMKRGICPTHRSICAEHLIYWVKIKNNSFFLYIFFFFNNLLTPPHVLLNHHIKCCKKKTIVNAIAHTILRTFKLLII